MYFKKISIFSVLLIVSCNISENKNQKVVKQDSIIIQNDILSSYHNSDTEVRIFENKRPQIGFGYDIFLNGVQYIHQPNIPAVIGNNGFNTKEKAQKAGEFVAYKIRMNIIPPSITLRELDSLGVLKK